MTDRVAVFVDAGYLLTAGALAVSGAVVRRQDVLLDAPAAIALCRSLAAAAAPAAALLRVYWYDAAVRSELTTEHRSVAREAGCRLRLGSVSAAGVQKGVDTAIVRDLGTLARHRAVSDAVLLTGDEDLHTGLDEAQEWGVRVHLAAVRRDRILAAIALQWDADSVIPITADQLAACIRVRPSARPGGTAEFVGALGDADGRYYAGSAAPAPEAPGTFAGAEAAPDAAPTAYGLAEEVAGATAAVASPAPNPDPALAVATQAETPLATAAAEAANIDDVRVARPSAPVVPLDAEQAARLRSWASRGGTDRLTPAVPSAAVGRSAPNGTTWSGDVDAATREEVEAVAHGFVAQLDQSAVRELHATIRPWGGVPPEWDRALILQAASTLEQPVLQEQVKRLLRQALYEAVRVRVAARSG